MLKKTLIECREHHQRCADAMDASIARVKANIKDAETRNALISIDEEWRDEHLGYVAVLKNIIELKDYERVLRKFDDCRACLALVAERMGLPPQPDDDKRAHHDYLIEQINNSNTMNSGE